MFRYVVNGPGRYHIVHSLFRSWNRRQQGSRYSRILYESDLTSLAFVSQSTNGIIYQQISVIWYNASTQEGLCKCPFVTVAQIWPRSTRERISDNFPNPVSKIEGSVSLIPLLPMPTDLSQNSCIRTRLIGFMRIYMHIVLFVGKNHINSKIFSWD